MTSGLLKCFSSVKINHRIFKKCLHNDNSTLKQNREPVLWQGAVKGLDPKQVGFFHSEKLIMVDDKDNVLGPISKGESHAIETIRNNVYHRALSLLVFDEQNRFLLTQRSSNKITFPDYFTNACCSHPIYEPNELEDDGEAIGVKRATIRRSHFELGTALDDIRVDELNFVNKVAYRATSDCGKWGEAEIDYIFVLRKNLKLDINPEEVQSYRYVDRSEMKRLLSAQGESNSIKVTPWLRLLARDHLFRYWDNLEDLSKVIDNQSIIDYRNSSFL